MLRKEVANIKLKNTNQITKPSFNHEGFIAGIAPNLRGSSATMYIDKPWVIKQIPLLSTVEENNIYYKKKLKSRLKNISIEFDIATNKGYDSDSKYTENDVGKTGVSIDSVEDIKTLFNQIPLDKIAVSMTISESILPILAFYIVAAKELGFSLSNLTGSIQKKISKEYINNDAISLNTANKILTDISIYANKNMPKFDNKIIIGSPLQTTKSLVEIDLAYTLANGIEYLQQRLEIGMNIDSFATKMSFFWPVGMNHFSEIAKIRAARMLWAKIIKKYKPKNPASLALRVACQTSSLSLSNQNSFNNITRTTIEAMAAVFGGVESLHTNNLNIKNTPSSSSEKIALNTQIYLQQETHITKTVDPWAGSYQLEKLTEDIANKAWVLIKEVEELGGITKALEKGIPKMRIEEATAKKQTITTNNTDVIIGVNKNQLKKEKNSSATLDLDYNVTRKVQIEKLKQLKTSRNNLKVQKSLKKLSEAVKNGKENLLELAIKTAKNRATLGEISDALKSTL